MEMEKVKKEQEMRERKGNERESMSRKGEKLRRKEQECVGMLYYLCQFTPQVCQALLHTLKLNRSLLQVTTQVTLNLRHTLKSLYFPSHSRVECLPYSHSFPKWLACTVPTVQF